MDRIPAALRQHIETSIGPIKQVFEEIESDDLTIDIVHVVRDDLDLNVLVTSGMSARAQAVPAGVEEVAFTEILLMLPAEWPLTREAFVEDERAYWPLRLLKDVARYVHYQQTFIGFGHTVAFAESEAELEPYADNTELCAAIILPALLLGEAAFSFEDEHGRDIACWSVVPLYRDELAFKMQYGADALMNQFDRIEYHGEVEPNRPSAVAARAARNADPDALAPPPFWQRWLGATHHPPLEDWYAVHCDADGATIEREATGGAPASETLAWANVEYVVYRTDPILENEAYFVFVIDRPEPFVVPIAALGIIEFSLALMERGLIDSAQLCDQAPRQQRELIACPEAGAAARIDAWQTHGSRQQIRNAWAIPGAKVLQQRPGLAAKLALFAAFVAVLLLVVRLAGSKQVFDVASFALVAVAIPLGLMLVRSVVATALGIVALPARRWLLVHVSAITAAAIGMLFAPTTLGVYKPWLPLALGLAVYTVPLLGWALARLGERIRRSASRTDEVPPVPGSPVYPVIARERRSVLRIADVFAIGIVALLSVPLVQDAAFLLNWQKRPALAPLPLTHEQRWDGWAWFEKAPPSDVPRYSVYDFWLSHNELIEWPLGYNITNLAASAYCRAARKSELKRGLTMSCVHAMRNWMNRHWSGDEVLAYVTADEQRRRAESDVR